MEKFEATQFIAFLDQVEKLKSVPRHCVTSDGVQENVAGHSWRAAFMAYLMKDELGEIDIDRVIRMCLVHDIGEAITGDIPTFEKNESHEEVERQAIDRLLSGLPNPLYQELTALFGEMEAQETKEAKVYKALDKLEAVIQHNESDIETWLPLEYELQQTYAAQNVIGFPFLEALQEQAVKRTKEKIAEKEAKASESGEDWRINRDAASLARQKLQAEDSAQEAADVEDGKHRRNPLENWKAQIRDAKEQREQKKQDGRREKETQKRFAQEERQKALQEKKEARGIRRQERYSEWRLLWRVVAIAMLITFAVLAIDQAGIYGFLFVWLFVAVMIASVALLLLGVMRALGKKGCRIIFGVAILGIILCTAWFIFLVSSYGLGIGPIPG